MHMKSFRPICLKQTLPTIIPYIYKKSFSQHSLKKQYEFIHIKNIYDSSYYVWIIIRLKTCPRSALRDGIQQYTVKHRFPNSGDIYYSSYYYILLLLAYNSTLEESRALLPLVRFHDHPGVLFQTQRGPYTVWCVSMLTLVDYLKTSERRAETNRPLSLLIPRCHALSSPLS